MNLRIVVLDLQDPHRLVDPEYVPAISAAFEAELLSPSGPDLIEGEEEEESWRNDIAIATYTLKSNADERARLSRELQRYQRHISIAQLIVQEESKAIERLRAWSKEPSEEQKENLSLEQATLEHAERNVKAVQEQLVPVEALDRVALEEKVRVLEAKIAARDENVFRYIREFEADRKKQ